MKGIILHGGKGTRLRPLTYAGPKQLLPVANKPISRYALDDLLECGIKDVAIVLGETLPEVVCEYYGDGSKFGARITYIYQGKPLGIAHAISLCRDFVGDDNFIVYLGDNLLQHGIARYYKEFIDNQYDAMVLLKEVEDPKRFGVAELDERGRLVRLVEKPSAPPSNYAVMGVYFLKPIIFEVIKGLKPSWRGELEITEALQGLIDRGLKVGYSLVDGWWFDTGKKDDILQVNAVILDERSKHNVLGEVINSKLEGRVEVGKGSRIVNSTIRGPASIGSDCHIEDTYIGPYTSVGSSCKIIGSSLEYCIIMEEAHIEGVERLEESLVGRRAKIIQASSNRRSIKLSISDYSEIYL